jgi:hypothetical protein
MSREEALAAAEGCAGVALSEIDPLWARAWIRILRGEHPWPSKVSREPQVRAGHGPNEHSPIHPMSIWQLLGVAPDAGEAELKAAYRRRALETHPDQGGDPEAFQRVIRAYAEAQRRRRRPRPGSKK